VDVGEMKQRAGQLTDQLLELASAVDDLLSGPDNRCAPYCQADARCIS